MPRGKKKDQKLGTLKVSTPADDAALYATFADENGNDTCGMFHGLPTYVGYFMTKDPDEITPERHFVWNTTSEELAAFPALKGSPRVVVKSEDLRPTKGFRFYVLVPEGVPSPDWDAWDKYKADLRIENEAKAAADKKKSKKEIREEFLKQIKATSVTETKEENELPKASEVPQANP